MSTSWPLWADHLTVQVPAASGWLTLVQDVRLHVEPGQGYGLVGESGSGKSVTALALVALLDGARVTGEVSMSGQAVLAAQTDRRAQARGRKAAFIFQEALGSLHPVLRVGEQVAEAVRVSQRVTASEARRRSVALLAEAGLPDPDRVATMLPQELSGGMRQRAQIAMALGSHAPLLIADEPTTALDVLIQAQVLDHLDRLRQRHGMGVLLISHDVGVVARHTDRMSVMYAGRIVEEGPTGELLGQPRHPYTHGLLGCRPTLDAPPGALPVLAGQVPPPGDRPQGCVFGPRCSRHTIECDSVPPTVSAGNDRTVACIHPIEPLHPIDPSGGVP